MVHLGDLPKKEFDEKNKNNNNVKQIKSNSQQFTLMRRTILGVS